MTALESQQKPRKTVNIALQGAGSHGAFGWGVLDRLLADGRLEIESISGTSAGAMNAVAVAEGLAKGGPAGARASLKRFWQGVSRQNPFVAEADEIVDTVFQGFNPWEAAQEFAEACSPYQTNPLDLNPFIDFIDSVIDFDTVRGTQSPKLFVTATNALSGRCTVFHRHEIDAKVVMASACLPNLFQAVEIGEHAYWDGGYTANPSLWPIVQETMAPDIIVVRLIPMQSAELPRTPEAILSRMHEIVFNNTLQTELRTIDFVNRMLQEKRLDPECYRLHYIHRIDGCAYIAKLPRGSQYDISPDFLEELHNAGQKTARAWLSVHYDDLGQRSTHDVEESVDRAGSQSKRRHAR